MLCPPACHCGRVDVKELRLLARGAEYEWRSRSRAVFRQA